MLGFVHLCQNCANANGFSYRERIAEIMRKQQEEQDPPTMDQIKEVMVRAEVSGFNALLETTARCKIAEKNSLN